MNVVVDSPQLHELAKEYGIATGYHDTEGHWIDVSAETLVGALAAMGVDGSTPEAATAAIEKHHDNGWLRVLPPCLVMRPSQVRTVNVHVPDGHPITVTAVLEDGTEIPAEQWENWAPPRVVDGVAMGEATFRMPPDLPLGYHRVRAEWDGKSAWSPLIVTPDRLPLPDRTWGIMTQLYSVRSERSWGIGDLTDLRTLVDWGAEHGAGFVLTNPMHAAEPVVPQEASPYLPTSRRFSHPIYLRLEAIPEYRALSRAQKARVYRLRHKLRDNDTVCRTIDRDLVWPVKIKALRVIHEAPRTDEREEAYRRYCFEQEEGLVQFARWMALAESFGADWRLWPDALRDCRSAELDVWAAEHADEVEFHMWLQWLLDDQMAAAQAAAEAAGMSIGVMGDLAVGVNEFGAETWANPDLYARGVTVGAPPDPYNMLGQNWSQPPMRPDRLAQQGYAPFRALVGTLLRHAGGLRVDHIIGLFRLWWIPAGMPATRGTYVYYDHEAMIGVLALEAYRAGAVVVGEDLGTVEPYVREYLIERGLLGTSILWWEKDEAGRPLPPDRYREACLASVTTHDLPPTAGYLEMAHVRLRSDLGLLHRPLGEEIADEATEQDLFLQACRDAGLLPPGFRLPAVRVEETAEEPAAGADAEAEKLDEALAEAVCALYGYLTRSPSLMLCAALTDLAGDRRIQNQPGTSREYPNWRVPLSGPDGEPILLEDALAQPLAGRLAAVLRGW